MAIPQRVWHFAHQGGAGLAPENTLVAFERGAALGANALELDIQVTRDGVVVVSHDLTVDRVTDGHGPISGFSLAELQRLDAGYRYTVDGGASFPFRGQGITPPTLGAIFARFPDLWINIDLKEPAPEKPERVWRAIQDAGAADRVIVGSFDCASLRRFRALSGGGVATSACPREVIAFTLARLSGTTRFLRPAYQALQVPETQSGIRVVAPGAVRAAHRLGVQVHVWTVDDRAAMERLLDWGVDGIMTDRPDTLAAVLRARQIAT